jgi:hypothetical protein
VHLPEKLALPENSLLSPRNSNVTGIPKIGNNTYAKLVYNTIGQHESRRRSASPHSVCPRLAFGHGPKPVAFFLRLMSSLRSFIIMDCELGELYDRRSQGERRFFIDTSFTQILLA